MDAPGKVPDSINCHACGTVIDLAGRIAFTHVECSGCGAASVVPQQFGDFLLLNVIGSGGIGTVYKAIDLALSRYVALKILREKVSRDPAFIASFSREARAAAAVNHPNVAQVYSFGEISGRYYLAMELCDAGSLDDRIMKLGQLPEADVLSMGRQIAGALHAAWRRDMLHRDVKPGNILFNEDGIPKIIDFGLARNRNAQKEDGPEVKSDAVWGTPYYVAPEKLRGKTEDVRSDIYSLGATLFHALAGRQAIDAGAASDSTVLRPGDPGFNLKAYVPSAHAQTIRVIERMLARDPADRYASYDEVTQELIKAEEALKEPTGPRATNEWSTKHFYALLLFGTLATLIICVVVWFAWRYHNGQPTVPAATPVKTQPAKPH